MFTDAEREGLRIVVSLLEGQPQDVITYERVVDVLSAAGFSCRLRCASERRRQSISILAPLQSLAPLEADIETPFGRQTLVLERQSSLPRTVESALQQIDYIRRMVGSQTEPGAADELKRHVDDLTRVVIEESLRFTRSGEFEWPMDRFEVEIRRGDKSQEVRVFGPNLARLAHAWLPTDTTPGVAVSEVGEAVVKVLLARAVDDGGLVGAGFRAQHKSAQAARLLGEFLESLSERASDAE